MTGRCGQRVLLINPTITSARSARFPLAVLSLATALEGRYQAQIIDGNVDRDFIASSVRAVESGEVIAVGVTVMGGPQLVSAIAVSKAIRARCPSTPIIWGGYFPTICPEAALRVPYVDYAIRGQGEDALRALLDRLRLDDGDAGAEIAGLSWKHGDIVHNPARPFSAASLADGLLYDRLDNPQQYLPRTFLGRRTAGYQAALGCRFRCTFCGVAALYRGRTALPGAARLEQDLTVLQQLGADSIQFYDHNFFDREVDMQPLLEIMAKFQLPWWCYARSDALVGLSPASWTQIRRSRLRMAYIGAESPSDWLLHDVRKGTRSDQTLAAVEACRSNDVIPELSFMLAPPQDPEGETERTFDFIRHIKRLHPVAEIVIYVYTPLPPAADFRGGSGTRAPFVPHNEHGEPVAFPLDADEWAQPRWLDYWCHADAPWLTPRLRKRIRDFTTVLGCRFPTATDVRTGIWGKTALRALSSWRYRYGRYGKPGELHMAKRVIRLLDPRVSSI
jgi:anaerobic magnesium-protoporphyrin IX monomethyl ester cyclase